MVSAPIQRRFRLHLSHIGGPGDYHTEWNRSDRQEEMSYDITYTWNLNYNTNELIYKTRNRLTDVGNKFTDITVGRGEEGINWEFEIKVYTQFSSVQLLSRVWFFGAPWKRLIFKKALLEANRLARGNRRLSCEKKAILWGILNLDIF